METLYRGGCDDEQEYLASPAIEIFNVDWVLPIEGGSLVVNLEPGVGETFSHNLGRQRLTKN